MALFDLSSVVDALSDETALTVTRRDPSTYTVGRLDAPSSSTITIRASVQPASGRDLKRLPEGSRVEDVLCLFTTTELLTQGVGQSPDLVTVQGADYEVQNVEVWASLGSFYKVLALKTGS